MNRLIERNPESVEIDGKTVPINTDFRACLLTIEAIEATELTQWEKQEILLENMYEVVPENQIEAIKKALWFLSGGKEPDGKEHPQYADFEMDSERIYDAFLAKGIALGEKEIHFWDFLSFYRELPQESAFVRVVQLRALYRRNKLSAEERRECEQIGWDVIRMEKKQPGIMTDEEIWQLLNGEG